MSYNSLYTQLALCQLLKQKKAQSEAMGAGLASTHANVSQTLTEINL